VALPTLKMSLRVITVRELLQANWHVVTIAITAGVIVCTAIVLVGTMPPRAIVMATGPEGGAYQEIGKQYKAALQRAGEHARLVTSAATLGDPQLFPNPPLSVNI